jgi:beta-galactosidase GanA
MSAARIAVAMICALAAFLAATGDAHASTSLPHLERRGEATQLIVDGAPWLVLGAELRGTASSTLSNMDPIWPELNRLHLNTVLLALGWDWIEPTEGHFDFALVDGLIAAAKQHRLRVVFLWFGTWKNGISSFAPSWVKSDQRRFPRARLSDGRSVEIISPFSIDARDADARAYATLMRHLRDTDTDHTVLMMQVENEIGLNGDTRDRGAAAEAAFSAPVPRALLEALSHRKAGLSPALSQRWTERGSKSAGSWAQVFGDDVVGDDIFMAWSYARYVDHVSAAGKAVYPLPVFTNTALDEPWDKRVRRASSGGPQYYLLDVWKAGAPSIDFNGPDIYSLRRSIGPTTSCFRRSL